MLKETFIKLTTIFSTNVALIHNLWSEIEHNYAIKTRHYHTLCYLENLLEQLNEVKGNIKN